MRKTTISSSIATVVAHVIDCVAVAGFAVRTFQLHALMREHLGYWLEPCQPGYATSNPSYSTSNSSYATGNPRCGNKPGLLRQCGIALAVCPAHSRLAPVQAARLG